MNVEVTEENLLWLEHIEAVCSRQLARVERLNRRGGNPFERRRARDDKIPVGALTSLKEHIARDRPENKKDHEEDANGSHGLLLTAR